MYHSGLNHCLSELIYPFPTGCSSCFILTPQVGRLRRLCRRRLHYQRYRAFGGGTETHGNRLTLRNNFQHGPTPARQINADITDSTKPFRGDSTKPFRGDTVAPAGGAATTTFRTAARDTKRRRRCLLLLSTDAGRRPQHTCRVSSARIAAKLPCSSFCQASYLRFTWPRRLWALELIGRDNRYLAKQKTHTTMYTHVQTPITGVSRPM